MGLKIGVVGTTGFARHFIPLFQAHPLVEEVVVADLIAERVNEAKTKFGIQRTYPSLDELCRSDVDAIAIFTQRHLHGAQSLQALRAGKHVYCAVPMAHSIEDVEAILQEVERRDVIYMTGETSYYYPGTIYCRNRFRNGDFGKVFYGEGAYIHDMSHGFYDAFQRSGGEHWKRVAGFPPMYYPTHSVSMILSVTGAYATHVSCLGYVDEDEDGIFREGGNLWDNPYSNQTALFRMSDGGSMRINEFRRAGWIGQGERSVHMSLFGTKGSYEEQANAQVWTSLRQEEMEDLTELLKCGTVAADEDDTEHEALKRDFYSGVSKVHPVHRLPASFRGMNNGHAGSHQFLVDDFVNAVSSHRLPPNHAWDSARYCIPGIVAHESAKRDGERLPIPDFGSPPERWTYLER